MKIYEKSDTFKWTFYQYVSPGGRKAIDDWRKSFAAGSRKADMDVFLRELAKKQEWEWPDIDSLKGKPYKGLSELRWKSGGVPQRIIGLGIGDHQYLFLIGCTHNKKKYTPPEALDTAADRRDKIARKEATFDAYPLIVDTRTPR